MTPVRLTFATALRLTVFALASSPFVAGCGRDTKRASPEPSAAPSATASIEVTRGGAAALLKGTWQLDGFIAASPSGSATVEALNAQVETEAAKAVRVTYTGDQVKIATPGSAVLSSSYTVLEDYPRRCVLQNGKDVVKIEIVDDDDHIVVDRAGNSFNANMRMHRVKPVAASAPSPSPGH